METELVLMHKMNKINHFLHKIHFYRQVFIGEEWGADNFVMRQEFFPVSTFILSDIKSNTKLFFKMKKKIAKETSILTNKFRNMARVKKRLSKKPL